MRFVVALSVFLTGCTLVSSWWDLQGGEAAPSGKRQEEKEKDAGSSTSGRDSSTPRLPSTDGPSPMEGYGECAEGQECSCLVQCHRTCTTRKCNFECDGNAGCSFECPKGGCTIDVNGNGQIFVDCVGGGCVATSNGNGGITMDCKGGNCILQCNGQGNCTMGECPGNCTTQSNR